MPHPSQPLWMNEETHEFMFQKGLQYTTTNRRLALDNSRVFMVNLDNRTVEFTVSPDAKALVRDMLTEDTLVMGNYSLHKTGQILYKDTVVIPEPTEKQSSYVIGDFLISKKAIEVLLRSESLFNRIRDQLKQISKGPHGPVNISMRTRKEMKATGRYFIAKIVNKLPSFSPHPAVQTSEAQAQTELKRLQKANPDKEFCIYPEMSYETQTVVVELE